MRDIYLFTACLVIIAGLSVGGYQYHTQVTEKLIIDYNSKFNTLTNQLNNFNDQFSESIVLQQEQIDKSNKQIDFLDKKLDIKSQQLTQDLESTTSYLQSNLNVIEQTSKQQIAELSGQIKNVELKSISNMADLKDQLGDLNIDASFADIIQQVLPAVVAINANGGIGSGAVYKSDGYIVTNKHVVQGETSVTVKTFDQKQYTGQVIGESSTKDIAIIKITANNLPFLLFANSADAKIGEKVIALGSPGGLDFTVTEGIISALNRIIGGVNHLQTDVSINPGNSGGPLVNKAGKILGINTMKIQGFEGVGFSISSNEVQTAISEISG